MTLPLEERAALVTGASGFSGRALVTALVVRGFEVRAFDRFRHPDVYPRARFVDGDVTCAEDVADAVDGVATVFHLASIVPYGLSHRVSARELEHVNVGGTRRVVDAARRAGVRRFVLASSTAVLFGGAPLSHADESHPPPARPNDAYSRTKTEAERIVLEAASPGFATLAIRPNGIWGPGEAHHIPKVLAAARFGATRVAFGRGALTDFTHRENLVQAFLLAEEKLRIAPESVSGRAYFVTDGEPFHTLEFFRPLLEGLGYAGPSIFVPGALVTPLAAAMELASYLLRFVIDFEPPLTRADVRKVVYDNYFDSSRARRALGYAPVIDRARGMAELVAYYRARGFGRAPRPSAVRRTLEA